MTILHSGSNNKYSTNWEKAFKKGASQKGKVAAPAKASAAKATKKSSKKK